MKTLSEMKKQQELWDSFPEDFRKNVLYQYNEAAAINDEPAINLIYNIFGQKVIIDAIRKEKRFVPGDVVRIKDDINFSNDRGMYMVCYYEDDLNELVRVENTYSGTRKTINANNLEMIR